MREPAAISAKPLASIVLVLVGVLVGVLAWMIPANLKSLSPALLRAAGERTPTLGAYGRDLVDLEKIGPASLFLAAAKASRDPRAPALDIALGTLSSKQPSLVAWGGWDPFLDPLFDLRKDTGRRASTPILTFFIAESSRNKLRAYLANTGSLGVQSVLALRDLQSTGRFVPATRAGGQPLDALILLTGLLYQGERLSPALQREVRTLAETALDKKQLGELEIFLTDLLSLGRRLDWSQLSELMRRAESTKTVGEFAQLARVTPDELPLIYAAALLSESADHVASYLIQYGRAGLADLRLALQHGQGAVRLLTSRQLPVNHTAGPALNFVSSFSLEHPQLTLAIKYLGYIAAVWLVLFGLDRLIVLPRDLRLPAGALPHMRSGLLSLLLAGIVIVLTEPFLVQAAPPSEYQLNLNIPVLVATTDAAAPANSQPAATMHTSTLISIGFFAALQVAMYFICLVKIRDVAKQPVSPLVRLRLMENEENLFDGGLYLGIAGTATALVLQVLRVIEPDLLAAYASNLFGITCVALVKIRHVRSYKRELIIEAQAEGRAYAS